MALLWILGFYGFFALPVLLPNAQKGEASSLNSLLPTVAGWRVAEDVQRYDPQTLFEYIDGAAEAYIGYDFKELIVAMFQGSRPKTSLTVEIYDMGKSLNAFGIYGAERFPESHFLPIGIQGYQEEGSLNFLADRYYVKLMCYEGGGKTEELLRLFADSIAGKIKNPGDFPALLRIFPRVGLVPNSEKFILRNFLGFKFLKNGFLANYKTDGQEFDCFLIDGHSAEDAKAMFEQVAASFAKSGRSPEKNSVGLGFKDAYLQNVFVARMGSYVCGVARIKDGQEALGVKFLEAMVRALNP
jgi:hypothetical protein